MSTEVAGIVLCGGQSRRMGSPKAWLPFGSERMLERIVRILSEVVSPIVVVAAPNQALPELAPEVHVVRDAERDRGPLEGLAAGLRRAGVLGAGAAFASSTDAPFLHPKFVRRVVDSLGDAAIAVPWVDGRHHPLAAVYRTSVLSAIDKLLAAERLRPVFLFDAVATRLVDAETLRAVDPDLRSLENMNTPADYEAALRRLNAIEPQSVRPHVPSEGG